MLHCYRVTYITYPTYITHKAITLCGCMTYEEAAGTKESKCTARAFVPHLSGSPVSVAEIQAISLHRPLFLLNFVHRRFKGSSVCYNGRYCFIVLSLNGV